MAHDGKLYKKGVEMISRDKKYSLDECFDTLVKFPMHKFDETVNVSFNLGVDPKQADQMVRGTVVLPHGTGKKVKILVFAKGEKEKEALAAGADYAGGDDLIEKIKGGWMDFDKTIATPDMMGSVGKVAKLLGPRGLMPNPKVGTVTFEIAKAIEAEKKGKVEFRAEKQGVVHTVLGKKSFGKDKLKENFMAIFEMVNKLKPATSKGIYIQGITVSAAMSPGIKLDIASIK